MTALSELLKRANDQRRMSVRARADKIEGRLHFATLADYQRGNHPEHPDEQTLQALADAYDLPLTAVHQAAGVQVGAGEWVPPPEVSRLDPRQQAAITELIIAIAKGSGGDAEATQNTPPTPAGKQDAGDQLQPGGVRPPVDDLADVIIDDEIIPHRERLPPGHEATVHQFPSPPELPDDIDELAARTEQQEPAGDRRRREQDEASEQLNDEKKE
ncbi:hypothetical protein ACOCHS_06485 [Propionibacteriaceae bacterium Y2011]